jgi:hypothetical protein
VRSEELGLSLHPTPTTAYRRDRSTDENSVMSAIAAGIGQAAADIIPSRSVAIRDEVAAAERRRHSV